MRLLLIFLISISGYTQDSINRLESTERVSNFFKKVAPDTANFFSEFLGPSADGGNFNLDSEGNNDPRDILTWNQVSFQWNLTEDKKNRFVFNPRFIINHSKNSAESIDPESAVVGYAGSFSSGKFSANINLNTILPFMRDRDVQDDNLMFNPGGFNSLNYQFSDSISGSLWVWFRMKFYEGRKDPNSDTKLSSFLAPYVSYKINDEIGSIAAFYWINERLVESDFQIDRNDNFNLMYSYTLNKYLTIQPFIRLYRANGFSLKTAQLNVWLSGTLF